MNCAFRLIGLAIVLAGAHSTVLADLRLETGRTFVLDLSDRPDITLFDMIAIRGDTGSLQFPGFDFSAPGSSGWNTICTVSDSEDEGAPIEVAVASGSACESLMFDILFAEESSSRFDFAALRHGTPVWGANVVWSSGSLSFIEQGPFMAQESFYWDPRDTVAIVPAPAAAILAAVGLGLVGAARRYVD